MFNFGCSFSLVTVKDKQKRVRSVCDLSTNSSYLFLSPGPDSRDGSNRRSPRTPRGVQNGVGESEDEGGGGSGESCWHKPPPGDSLSFLWDPVRDGTDKTTSRPSNTVWESQI